MAVTKAQKTAILADLTEQFQTAKSTTFTTYSGLTVGEMQELRRSLRADGARLVVAKKTLIQLAAKEAGLPELAATALEGPIAVAFAHEDELAAAQALHTFSKDHDQITLTGGILDGETLSKAAINQLATLPSKSALLGQLVSVLIGPVRGFVGVGHGVVSGFVRVVDAVAQQRAASEAA